MDGDPWWLQDYHGATTVHPVGLAAVIVLAMLTVALPRRFAAMPMLALACFIPSAQRIVVIGLDFDYLRILTLVGWFRVLVRGEFRGFRMVSLDWLVIAYAIAATAAYTIQQGTTSALINRLGLSYNAVGMYLFFRWMVRDLDDIRRIAALLGLLALPVAVALAIENTTGRNAFAMFGGVPEITKIRDGRMRCQGAFAHPILAGMFWAVAAPLIATGLMRRAATKVLAIAGTVAASACVVLSASSTPVMGLIFAMVGGLAWFIRDRLGMVRWLLLGLLVVLHFTMKAPVYHLIARINVVGGSTSWHRYNLMHQFFTHPEDWLMVGTRTTEHWGVSDMTNQFVLEGVRGGIVTLLLFVAMVVVAFVYVGRSARAVRPDRKAEVLAFALGVSLFVHVTGFIGVSYFGQITMLWYLSLAMIGSVMSGVVRKGVPSAESLATGRPAGLLAGAGGAG